MAKFGTIKEIEYYIITPINVAGNVVNDGIPVHYNDTLEIETFEALEEYEKRCKELGIELEDTLKTI